MRVWRRAIGGAFSVLLLVAGGAGPSKSPPTAPPGVAGLLPDAVVLREVTALALPAARESELLGVHDLDGDGWTDLVVATDRRVQVLLGDGRGGFRTGPWVYLEVEEYKEGQPIPGRTVREAEQRIWKPYELEEREGRRYVPHPVGVNLLAGGALVDLDRDGILDVVVVGWRALEPGDRLYLLRGLGGGLFARAGVLPYPQGKYLSRLFPADHAVLFTVASEGGPTRLYRLSAEEGLENPRLEKLLEGPWLLQGVADLSGEGEPDLVVSTRERVQVLIGDGTGGFREGPSFAPRAGEVHGVELADLDGEGSLDLVVRTYTGIVTALRRGEEYAEAFARDLGFPLWEHVVADFTGDGVPDLLVQRAKGFHEYLLLPGDGGGGFLNAVAEFVVVEGHRMREPRAADLNADGLLDLVFCPLGGETIRVYLNGGRVPGASLHPLPGTLLAVGDLSGDGSPEVLVADVGRRGVGVFWNNGRGGLVFRPLAELGRSPLAGAVARPFVCLLLPETEWLSSELVLLDSFGRVFARFWVPSEVLPNLAVGDFDGDGLLDVAIPAKTLLLVLWGRGMVLRSYRWPAGEVSLLAPGSGKLWAVSVGEYADLVEVRFARGRMTVSAPILQLEALPLTMTCGDLDGDGIADPVVLAVELGAEVADGRAVVFPARAVAGMALSSAGARVEEVPGFPKDHLPWPFLGAAVARSGGVPHLVYTTSAGGGVFRVPWQEGFGAAVRVDLPGGPILAADLDGNGEDEALTATVGLGTLLGILWNGGGR
ncbi:MAG: VCBS repeat-containing protein [Candidatus Bipolaricaulota bacterium]|nr:VCBS repeat-containing protein [Candidatus Bipolaricaulota bacterium]MDW8152480.1 VCBS repeat-containing protein [Candidatus Bipolaricaulota bacterium]